MELQIKGHGLSILTLNQNQDSFTDDGWFKTGDVNLDQDGYMEIKDRTKDLIKSEANGFQVLL
jgi:fatty-acyl-CoA synthase